jgi:hypothetical protein
MGSSKRRLLNQSTHLSVSQSTEAMAFHGPNPVDDFGFVEAVYGFGQGIVIGVTDAAD